MKNPNFGPHKLIATGLAPAVISLIRSNTKTWPGVLTREVVLFMREQLNPDFLSKTNQASFHWPV